MMKVLFPVLFLFLVSCTPKPDVTPEQIEQYNYCKKILVDNKAAFISTGATKESRDSLADYVADIEKYSFPDLLQKYEAEQEQVVLFLLSICQNADAVNKEPSVEETMEKADSMIKALDSIIKADSIRNLQSR